MYNINDILNKYFEGETTIEEERLLGRYFQGDDVKDEHKAYTPIFQHLAQEKEINTTINPRLNRKKHTLNYAVASCAAILIGILVFNNLIKDNEIKSVVYVDGKRINNIEIINSEALNSIMSIEDDTEILESQIDLLDFFTE